MVDKALSGSVEKAGYGREFTGRLMIILTV